MDRSKCHSPLPAMCTHVHRQREFLPWIETPIDEKDGDPPHLYRNRDATPVELFFDLFFVANLSTFTATHEINNVEGDISSTCHRLV